MWYVLAVFLGACAGWALRCLIGMNITDDDPPTPSADHPTESMKVRHEK
jgi:hypothetical protein